MIAKREDVGLPTRPFLYTLDQIASLATVDLVRLKADFVYYRGRSTGIARKDVMRAHNIAPVGHPPDWRVSEVELIRWLRSKRFRIYERVRFTEEP